VDHGWSGGLGCTQLLWTRAGTGYPRLVVSVLGLEGIGKSALVTSAMRQAAEHFQVVLFRSLRDAPACSVLLEDCLHVLTPQSLEVGVADL
jgi:hypothetical protein